MTVRGLALLHADLRGRTESVLAAMLVLEPFNLRGDKKR